TVSFLNGLPENDRHIILLVEEGTDNDPGQQRLTSSGHRSGGRAELSRTCLVKTQLKNLDRLVPVVIEAVYLGIRRHSCLNLVGPVTHQSRVRSLDAELHWVGHRWTVGK